MSLIRLISVAMKYRVGKLYLIGSSLSKDIKNVNDYDFAVSGVPRGSFFKFYGELFRTMSKNVDIIDLSGKKTKFKSIVLKEEKKASLFMTKKQLGEYCDAEFEGHQIV